MSLMQYGTIKMTLTYGSSYKSMTEKRAIQITDKPSV